VQIRALIVNDEPLGRERVAALLEPELDIPVMGERGDGKRARFVQSKPNVAIFKELRVKHVVKRTSPPKPSNMLSTKNPPPIIGERVVSVGTCF
jgi:DNA-binding NarL/FixJ family response regulator